ncbi:MAG: OmpA family protein [bacterium]|nr:OmpA family protein [bacterium]
MTMLLMVESSSAQDSSAICKPYYMPGDTLPLNEIRFSPSHHGKVENCTSYPLEEIFVILTSYPSMNIEISNHTDFRGSANKNRELTLSRAKRLKKYLVDKGIDPERISTVGCGEDDLIYEEEYCIQFYRADKSEYERLLQKNRRTVIVVTAI